MDTTAAMRPQCRACNVQPVAANRHKLCRRCLVSYRCIICGAVEVGKNKASWCKRCQAMNRVCHAIKLQSPGVSPDDDTLAYRLELYAVRAADGKPLFDPPAWF